MAKFHFFGRVAKEYTKLDAAIVAFQKAVALAAEPGDAVRLSKINACLPDMATLHGLLKAIRTTEIAARGPGDGDDDTLGGGNTPEDP